VAKTRWWSQRRNRVMVVIAAAVLAGLAFVAWPAEFQSTEARIEFLVTTVTGIGTAAVTIQGIINWIRAEPAATAQSAEKASPVPAGHARPAPSGPDSQPTVVIQPAYTGPAYAQSPVGSRQPWNRRVGLRRAGIVSLGGAVAIGAAILAYGIAGQAPSSGLSVPAMKTVSVATAERTLTDDHLKYQLAAYPECKPVGTVSHLAPGPGTPVKNGSMVTMYVCGRDAAVPLVSFAPLSVAEAKLSTYGFQWSVKNPSAKTEIVVNQAPFEGVVEPRASR